MIAKMRKMAPAIMIVTVLAFVSTIFVSWGMGSAANRHNERAIGRVGKENIILKNFARDVDTEKERMRMNANGGELTPQELRQVPRNIMDRTLHQIIHRNVLKKMDLFSTPDEVFAYLCKNPIPEFINNPAFQTDSVFDTTKYIDFLNRPESFDYQGMDQVEAFATSLANMQKLQILVESGGVPSRSQIDYEYKIKNEKALFEYLKVDGKDFVVDSSTITDEMVTKYYNENPDSFNVDEQAKLDFIRIPKIATAADHAFYLDELKEITQRIESGESTFEDEAKIESDDEGSAINGGELGWFARGQMVPEFEEVAFDVEPGTIKGPVKTAYGYHLIYVKDRKIEDDKEMVKACHILRKIEPTGETLDSLSDLADSLIELMVEKGFKGSVESNPIIKVDSTDLFSKGAVISGIGFLKGASYFAFSKETGVDSISDLMENQQAYYILSLKRRNKAGKSSFDDVKEHITGILMKEAMDNKARAYLEDAVKKVSFDSDLKAFAEQDSFIVGGITDTVGRKQYVLDIGYDNGIVDIAISADKGKFTPIVTADRAFFIIKPVWRLIIEQADISLKTHEMDQIRRELMTKERKSLYLQWYSAVKANGDVEDNLTDYYMD